MPYTRLAATTDIPADRSLAVTRDGKHLLICHSAGRFSVVENRCSHSEQPLDCGRIRAGWVACPVHGARFDLATGAVLHPPATEAIRIFPAQVVDGWVEADLW